MKHRGGIRKRQGGGAAVEFAIVMPIFCGIVFGMIDYGWFFYQKFTLAAAIRDGARTGASYKEIDNPATAEVDDAWTVAKKWSENNLPGGGIPKGTVVYDEANKYTGAAPTRTMTLKGTYAFKPLLGFVPLPKSNTMTYSMTMVLEQQF